jgi:hypothetical protein
LCAYCLLPVVAVLLSTMCMRVWGGRRVAYVVRQNYLGTSCVCVCVCVGVCVVCVWGWWWGGSQWGVGFGARGLVLIWHCLNRAAVDELFKCREDLSITNCSLSCELYFVGWPYRW